MISNEQMLEFENPTLSFLENNLLDQEDWKGIYNNNLKQLFFWHLVSLPYLVAR